jgi:transcriptional regulator with XRE-family HTH domain
MLERLLLALKGLRYLERGGKKKLADLTGYSQGTISDILSGKESLSGKFIHIACAKLRISENWIENGEGEMFIAGKNNLSVNNYRYVDPQAGNDARSGGATVTGEEEDLEARLLHREWVGMSPDQRLALIQAARRIRAENKTPDQTS